jgi:microsomal dipeptidase-like Zn-dependent dipeptidase
LYSRYDSGLTSLGKDFIDALSKDGFIIDMSHASEKSIRDTMKVINNNVVVTHGTTFEIDKHSRGWRNSILKELSERCQYFGQIIGPVPLPKKHVDYVRFVLQRIEYAVRFFGYNKVGIASDWQWGWEEPCVLSMLDLWESHYHKQKVCENWRQMGLSVKGFIPLNFLEVMIEEKHSLDAVRHVAGRNLINCLVHRKSE